MPSFPVNVPVASSIPRLISDIRAFRSSVTRAIQDIQSQQAISGRSAESIHRRGIQRAMEAINNIQLIRDAYRDANAQFRAEGVSATGEAVTARVSELTGMGRGDIQSARAAAIEMKGVEKAQTQTLLAKERQLVSEVVALKFEETELGRELILQEAVLNRELANTVEQRRQLVVEANERATGAIREQNLQALENTQLATARELQKEHNDELARAIAARAEIEGIRDRNLQGLENTQLATARELEREHNDELARSIALRGEVEAIREKNLQALENIQLDVARAVEKERNDQMAASMERRAIAERDLAKAIVDRARLTGQSVASIEAEVAATNMSTAAIVAENEVTRTAIQQKRRLRAELIGASIGMFVFGITITQTISGLAGIIASGKESAKTVTFLSNTVKAALGPIQVFMGILQFWNIANIEVAAGTIYLRTSLLSLVGVLGTLILFVAAFRAENKNLRAVLMGLATTVGLLTAYFTYLRIAQIRATIANIFNQMVGTGGLAAPVIAASIAGAAILAGVAVAAATASFDTQPGMMKRVGKTGLAVVHEGETFSRPASIGDHKRIGSMLGGGGTSIYINVHGDLDRNAVKQLSRRFDALQVGSVSVGGGF